MTTRTFGKKAIARLALACLALVVFAPLVARSSDDKEVPKPAANVRYVEFGFNLVDVNGARPAKFYQGSNVPSGFVLPTLRWDAASPDLSHFLQVKTAKSFRTDEQLSARFGLFGVVEGRLNWTRLPWVYGNGAKTLLSGAGTDIQRQSSLVQQTMQDPNHDGLLGTEADNLLVPDLVRDLFSAATPFSLSSKRQTGAAAVSFFPAANWNIDLSYLEEKRAGMRPMGSGTYDRLTFTPGSGVGQDENFYLRGTELARPIGFKTGIFRAETSYGLSWGFVSAGLEWSRFRNQSLSLSYSNPLWYTDTYSRTAAAEFPGIYRGWSRGLWNEGRFALEPSNDGFSLNFSGGLNLPRSTRLSLTFVHGTVTQDVPFLPYTSNTALNGRVDLNGDGVVDGLDVGTEVSTLPQTSLNGKAQSTSYTLSLSSRPIKQVQINVRLPYFKYENKHGQLSFPFRAEYAESNWNTGIQGVTPVLTELTDYSVKGLFAEAIVRPIRSIAVRLYGETRTRDYAEREVTSTGTRTAGIGLTLTPTPWLDARFSYARINRKLAGIYTPKYAGEQQALRMFDIAKLERDAFNADFSVEAGRKLTLGGNVRLYDDRYPDSTFGLQATKTAGFGLDASLNVSKGATLYAYSDFEKYDFQGHGDTKMGTFNRPGNDWFYAIADKTISFGAGFDADIVPQKYTLALNGYWVDGNVASSNRNSGGTPYSPLAAGAVNFPNQESRLSGLSVRLTRQIGKRYSVGIAYWVEQFKLADFAWDNMNPYGFDFLTVDEALRYMFLDSRYGSYAAHIGTVFVRINF